MSNKKWLTPLPPYLAIWAGLFLFHNAWVALLGFHAGILLVLAILRPGLPVNILFKGNDLKRTLRDMIFCGISGIGLYILWNHIGAAKDLPAQLQSLGLNSSSWFPFIAYFVLVNPLIEEYFWRGVLGGHSTKPTLDDLVYAGYHAVILLDRVNLISIAFAVIILVSAGWLWRQIAREEGGLLVPVLGHMAADLSILLTIYFMTS